MEEDKRLEDRKKVAAPRKRPRKMPVLSSGNRIEGFGEEGTHIIRSRLLEWYDHNRRDLPWRSSNTFGVEINKEDCEKRAYRVWVSEVMLQQTRVQTVMDYYNRWMLRWPSVFHLSSASLEEVNELWSGLGYYRRARYLLEGAKMIVAEGEFPKTVPALRKVPGIGDYTAGAIASIAFNEAVPVVDGNVTRVLARLKAVSSNPKALMTVKNFWKLSAQLVDPCRPGDFNQSLMELGATICTPSNPKCSSCPVSGHCDAFSISNHDRSVQVTDYPSKTAKVKQRHDFSAVCVVEILEHEDTLEGGQYGSSTILVKRPDEGLLAGLWEFPSVMFEKDVDLATRRKMTDSFLKKSFRLNPGKTCTIVLREDIGDFIHVFSHIRRKIYVELLLLHFKGGINELFKKLDNKSMTWKCMESNALSSMGLTSGVRKVYNIVKRFKQNRLCTKSSKQETELTERT